MIFGGCQGVEAWPAPPIGEARTMIVLYQRDGIAEEAYVLDASAPLPSVRFLESERVRVYLWLYELGASTLGFVPGPIDLRAEVSPVLDPQAGYVLEAPFAAWREDPASLTFAQLPIPRDPAYCAPFADYERFELRIPGSTGAGPLYSENRRFGSLMVGNAQGLWEVGAGYAHRILGGAVTSTTAPADLATHPFVASHWDPHEGGAHYFYQADGRLWEIYFGITGFRPLPTRPNVRPGTTWAWMDGADEFNPPELFVLDQFGALYRYDENGWEVWREPDPPEQLGAEGKLIWTGPGKLMFLGEDHALWSVDRGIARRLEVEGMARPRTLHYERARGVFVGDEAGQLWISREGDFRRVQAPRIPPAIAVGSHGDGILYGGAGGELRYFQDGLPGCNDAIHVPTDVFRVVRLYEGETVILSSSTSATRASTIHLTSFDPVRR